MAFIYLAAKFISMIFSNAIHWSPNPEILSLGAISIRWYSLCFVIAFSFGFVYVRKLFRKDGVQDEKMDKLLMYVVLATIFGARLGHVLFYDLDYYLDGRLLEAILPIKFDDGIKFVGFSGLASHGGAIALIIALYAYSKRVVKKPLHWIFDRIAPAIAFAGAFIRVGNFMNSEIIGNPTGSDFGVIFDNVDQLPRHPAQLYEAIGYFILFLLLNKMIKNDKLKQPWFVFSTFLIALFSIRFVVEFFKKSQGGFEETLSLLSTGQWLSIPFIILGIVLLQMGKKANKTA